MKNCLLTRTKFSYPEESLTRTQCRRLQRQRKEAREYYYNGRKEYRPKGEHIGKSSDEQEMRSMSEDATAPEMQENRIKQ